MQYMKVRNPTNIVYKILVSAFVKWSADDELKYSPGPDVGALKSERDLRNRFDMDSLKAIIRLCERALKYELCICKRFGMDSLETFIRLFEHGRNELCYGSTLGNIFLEMRLAYL